MEFYLDTYKVQGSEPKLKPTVAEADPGWTAIDLRPDGSVADGWAISTSPVRSDTPQRIYLGNDADAVSVAMRNQLRSRLGVTLVATKLRDAVAELLLQWGTIDATRWKPLRASMLARRFEIFLGGSLFWSQPVVSGGAAVGSTFTQANSSTVTNMTELVAGLAVVSNKLVTDVFGTAAVGRLDAALATVDQRVSADIDASSLAAGAISGLLARKDGGPTMTFYYSRVDMVNNAIEIDKYISNTSSALTGGSAVSAFAAGVARSHAMTVDGSSITTYLDGAQVEQVTDTSIPGSATSTRVGVRGNKTTSGTVGWDNLVGEDLYQREDHVVRNPAQAAVQRASRW